MEGTAVIENLLTALIILGCAILLTLGLIAAQLQAIVRSLNKRPADEDRADWWRN